MLSRPETPANQRQQGRIATESLVGDDENENENEKVLCSLMSSPLSGQSKD